MAPVTPGPAAPRSCGGDERRRDPRTPLQPPPRPPSAPRGPAPSAGPGPMGGPRPGRAAPERGPNAGRSPPRCPGSRREAGGRQQGPVGGLWGAHRTHLVSAILPPPSSPQPGRGSGGEGAAAHAPQRAAGRCSPGSYKRGGAAVARGVTGVVVRPLCPAPLLPPAFPLRPSPRCVVQCCVVGARLCDPVCNSVCKSDATENCC